MGASRRRTFGPVQDTLQTGDKFDRPERKHQYEERDPDIAHAVFPLNERPEAGDSALHP